MGDTRTMRASDRDRQDVVDRLRGAVGDGRLGMDEYMERIDLAYQAVTYSDLSPLHADLPASGSPASALPARHCFVAGLPVVLRVLWAIWLCAVSAVASQIRSSRARGSHRVSAGRG